MAQIRVEVVYALPGSEDAVPLTLPAGSTLREALRASGLCARHPEIDPDAARLGVYGQLRPLDAPLADGDRVEIYRPLKADPKDARRARAASRRTSR
jgi:putative ubiquitin-RnfH superfamily antitoxin RatB of RatAB toxin-antitoxin module